MTHSTDVLPISNINLHIPLTLLLKLVIALQYIFTAFNSQIKIKGGLSLDL